MPLIHLLLALSVVFIWGTNFVVIKWALADIPPFLFATLRFALCVLPWIFLIPRPAVPWRTLAGVGLLIGVGQFGLVYWAMREDITAGLASLVVQAQVFLTIIMFALLKGERTPALQKCALALAAAGYGVVAWRSATDPGAAVTLLGLALVLAAGLSWACSNLLVRSAGRVNMLGLVVWSSGFSIAPLFAISLATEGPGVIAHSLASASAEAWVAVLWQALGNTLYGFGVWNWLLARHPAATLTPMALLVPVFGMLASAVLLHEPLPAWKLLAASLVMAGLALNVYAGRRVSRRGGPG